MAYTYLEFEKPISDLENKIESLRDNKIKDENVHQEISSLSDKIENLTKEIYEGLSIWQKVQVARHPHRPHFSDYIENIFTDFDELHGDRLFGDDQAIIGGLAKFKGSPVVIIGHEKGKSTEDKISRNFGMSQPEGYRKASRLMKLAEDFSLPIITFIDTPGAYPGIESEERGMSEAIAKNLSIMSGLKVPIIVIITGEGGKSPSRFKHVVKDSTKKLRRLTPIEAERLNGFPDDWTLTETMPTNFRYFCMGNALVVPLVTEIMKGIQ